MKAADALALMAKVEADPLEADIKKDIRWYMEMTDWFVIPIFQGAKGIPAHIKKGISDWICVKHGRVVFTEIKRAKGKQSEHQIDFEAEVKAHGGEYVVLRSIEDAMKLER
jgi:hypothetical protein